MTQEYPLSVSPIPMHARYAVPASRYSYQELADIYNQARVDYIVPMPMNAKRMKDYIVSYDIDLDASVVALNEIGEPMGVGMLGVRGARAWITRLGVIPERRGYKIGQFLMESLLQQAQNRACPLIQLEVIQGNEPAYRLFQKLGFRETRNLLIIRRPPGPLDQSLAPPFPHDVMPISPEALPAYLSERQDQPSWLEETPSLLNAGNLKGLLLCDAQGRQGWVIYQQTPFQLTHVVLHTGQSDDLGNALIYHLHQENPLQDTKIENLPSDSPLWPIFQQFGYIEAFSRIEMVREEMV